MSSWELDTACASTVGGVRFEIPLRGPARAFECAGGYRGRRESSAFRRSSLREAVRSLTPGKMRGERLEHNGIMIWNDCYNSNPEAVRAMLDVLRATPARRRMAVLGEMLELGHRPSLCTATLEITSRRRGLMCSLAYAALPASWSMRPCGRDCRGAAYFFEDPAEAGDFLRGVVRAGRRRAVQRFTRRAGGKGAGAGCWRVGAAGQAQ